MPSWPQTSSFRYVHIFYLILIVGESMLASCSTGCWCAFRDKQQLAKLSLQAARSLQWHHQAGQHKSGTPNALQQHSTGGKDRDKEGHNRAQQAGTENIHPPFPILLCLIVRVWFSGFCLFVFRSSCKDRGWVNYIPMTSPLVTPHTPVLFLLIPLQLPGEKQNTMQAHPSQVTTHQAKPGANPDIIKAPAIPARVLILQAISLLAQDDY